MSKKAVSVLLIVILILIPTMGSVSAFRITYPSVVSVELLPESIEMLSDEIPRNEPTYVLFNVSYAVNVPEWLLNGGPLLKLWLYHRFNPMPVHIRLQPDNVPDGVDISVRTEVYIPTISNDFVSQTAVLSILPSEEAVSYPTTFLLHAFSDSYGKILAYDYTTTFVFEVEE